MITSELQGDERAIPALEDVRLLMEQGENAEDKVVRNLYMELFKLLSKVDREVIEEAKRRYPEMAEAWMEIFAPEIKEREIRAAVEAVTFALNDEEEAISSVANQYGMNVADVKSILEKKEPVAV